MSNIITKSRLFLENRRDFVAWPRLDLADVLGVGALWAVLDLEGESVALLELVERNVLERVGMEEKVLRAFRRAIDFNKAEALQVLLDYCAVLHS